MLLASYVFRQWQEGKTVKQTLTSLRGKRKITDLD
jgi:hypothetical protein